jgi:hypothetical protein
MRAGQPDLERQASSKFRALHKKQEKKQAADVLLQQTAHPM